MRYGLKQLRPQTIVSVATLPERSELLERMLDSIEPQTDRINVYLDGHDEIPERVRGDKFVVHHRTIDQPSMRAAGKFRWAHELPSNAYHFTCDDDIVYPDDYVERMSSAIEKYERRAAIGVHSIRFMGPPYSFYKKRVNYSMRIELPEDMRVHALGTGTLAYHTSTLDVRREDFPEYNAEDLFFAICCKRQGVDRICIARKTHWVRAQPVHTYSVYGEYLKTEDDSWQTRFMEIEGPWEPIPIPPVNHAAIQRWFAMRVRGQ